MVARGDHDRVAEGGEHSFHSVRPEAFNYVWDNSIEPELEIDSGEVVTFAVRDASDEQIRADSTSEDVAKLDFEHVNPVSGPVYVRGAQPGDVLAVEIFEFRPREWGWTALIPGFGLLADDFPSRGSGSHVLRLNGAGLSSRRASSCPTSRSPAPSVWPPRSRAPTRSCLPRAGAATWTPSTSVSARRSTCQLA